MQNNSQGRRDNLATRIPADDATDVRPEARGHRVETDPIDEAAVIEPTTTMVFGVVTDCLRLNIRKEPISDGEILTIIDALSEVMVDIDAASGEFYKVCTASGIEGFCMKKYIALRR